MCVAHLCVAVRESAFEREGGRERERERERERKIVGSAMFEDVKVASL